MTDSKSDRVEATVSDEPGPEDLRRLAEDLIAGQSTMTLATALKDIPWAAPVYYVPIGFRFYFFSDPNSRHIREAVETGHAAAAIFYPASTWREIRGIQMSGSIRTLPVGIESLKALRAYLHKFPFTSDFFDTNQKMDLEAFAKRFRVRMFGFDPSLMYYMDNRIKFSFREEVLL